MRSLPPAGFEDARHYQFHGSRRPVDIDPELLAVFDGNVYPYRTFTSDDVFDINISGLDFYRVMTAVDAQNAPLLISAGLTDKKSVIDFLHRHNLAHLIRRNSKIVTAAKRLKIQPGSFYEIYRCAFVNRNSHEEILAWLKMFNEFRSYPLLQKKKLLFKIIEGKIKYEDASLVGLSHLESSSNEPELTAALEALRYDKTFTVDHVQNIVDMRRASERHLSFSEQSSRKYALDTIERNDLYLMRLLGGDFAASLRDRQHLCNVFKRNDDYKHLSREEQQRLYRYADDVRVNTVFCDPPSRDTIYLMFKAGVSVDLFTEGIREGWDENRILALNEDVHTSITDGFL